MRQVQKSFAFITLVLVCSAFACGDDAKDHNGKAGKADGVKRCVIRQSPEWTRLNPLTARLPRELKILRNYLNLSLLITDPDSAQPIPWLVEALPKVEGSTSTWTLREGAAWTDGKPVTSDDIVLTFETLRRYAVNGITTASFNGIRGDLIAAVEKVDARTFRVVMPKKGRRQALDFGLHFIPIASHTLESTPDKIGNKAVAMGSGPYRVKDGGYHEERLILSRKKDWWGETGAPFKGRFRLEEIIFKDVNDERALEIQLERGMVDFAVVPPDRWVNLSKVKWPLERAKYYLPKFSYIGWNCSKAPFDDARVRRAMAHFIPRKKIVDNLSGLGQPVSGPFAYGTTYYDDNVTSPRFSPKVGLALLAEAGWRDTDGDGRLDKDGKPFNFSILEINETRAVFDKILTPFVAALSQAGIEAKIEMNDFKAVYERASAHDFDAYICQWEIDRTFPQEGIRSLLHSSQCDGGFNWQAWKDKETDALVEAFDREEDDEKSRAIAHKIHKRIAEEQPFSPLVSHPVCIVWNPRLKNVKVHTLGVKPWDFDVEAN